MDGQRFDRSTRALAGGTDRRRLLRRPGAGAAGLALASSGRAARPAAAGILCAIEGEACGPELQLAASTTLPPCCPGLDCVLGVCVASNGAAGPLLALAHLGGEEAVPPVATHACGQALFHLNDGGGELG